MRITLIGGVERNERALSKIAESLGYELDFHGGHMNGRGVEVIHRAKAAHPADAEVRGNADEALAQLV